MKIDINTLFGNCNNALDAGNCTLAYSFLEQAYPLLLNYPPQNIAWAFYHLNLASVYNNMGRFAESCDCCLTAVRIIPVKGYEDLRAKVESSFASSYLNTGDFSKSFEHANNALRLYNKVNKNGRYLPIEETKDNVQVGVVYRYNVPLEQLLSTNENYTCKRKFSVIGLQPFKRPGEQKGFALQLEKGENLNHVHGIEKYFFRHDKLASEIIYNRMNQGKDLFPYDELEEFAKNIKYSKKISNIAFQLALEKYPVIQMDKELVWSACIRKGIKLVNYPLVSFSKRLEKIFLKNWEKHGEREFYSKIVHRPVFEHRDTPDL